MRGLTPANARTDPGHPPAIDAVDAFDLFCDAAGIALALLVHRQLMRTATASAGKIRAAIFAWSGSGPRKTPDAA